MTDLLRFADLAKLGIVRNRTTLARWQKTLDFPEGFLIGANTRVWNRASIDQWLAARADARNAPIKAA
jgi:predicted DNA-binding transcriptional regulator AlpA